MTIIGVTDEPAAKIKPFIEQKGIKYVVALGGANEYQTRGIPHSWLVGPKGLVVWEGHPASLKDSQIEENLKEVSLTPTFSLPKELKAIEKDLNAGKYAAALKALETHLKKPKSPETEAAAKDAVAKVKAYGEERLKLVEEFAKSREYADGGEILIALEKSFKGHEVGDKASKMLSEWKKDKKIKVELEGAVLIQKAEPLIQEKKYKAAAPILLQVAKGKKYEGTKVQEKAMKRYRAIEGKL